MQWYEYIDKIMAWFAGLLTPLVAVIALWIARRQGKNDELKTRHELHEKRRAVYAALTDLLAHILAEADVDIPQLRTFALKTSDAYFLFGKGIADYLHEIYRKGVHYRLLNLRIHGHVPVPEPERIKACNEANDLSKWFSDQFEESREKFSEFLKLH